MSMARKDGPGLYQVGIYQVRRERRRWLAHAVGPGTIGDGYVGTFDSLAAAYLALTGEPLRTPKGGAKVYRVRKNSLSQDVYWSVGHADWVVWKSATRYPSQDAAERAMEELNAKAGRMVAGGIF